MTNIVYNDARLIAGVDEVRGEYCGVGADAEIRIGTEHERNYHHITDSKKVMNRRQQRRFCETLSNRDHWRKSETGENEAISISLEAISYVVENQSRAYPVAEISRLIDEDIETSRIMQSVAGEMDLRQGALTHNPFVSVSQARNRPSATLSPRIKALMRNYRGYFGNSSAIKYGVLTSPIHLNISYVNETHLYNIAKRTYYLTPFLYMLSENNSGYMESRQKPLKCNFTMMVNQSNNDKGGIPEHFFTSSSPEEFIVKHIDNVMNSPMFMYYGQNGDLIVPSDASGMPRFMDLCKTGLNSISNYNLAESMTWPDGKICSLRDSEGKITGKRFEVRMWDVGPWQYDGLVLLCAAALADKLTGQDVDTLLSEFGFPRDPRQAREVCRVSMENSCWHCGQFMEVLYGKYKMIEFARRFTLIVEAYVKGNHKELLKHVEPLSAICMSGETDRKVIAETYKSIDEVGRFMEEMPMDIYTRREKRSLHQMREYGELPRVGSAVKRYVVNAAV